jgi:GH24 family phage-related lysozyme (muramidase)
MLTYHALTQQQYVDLLLSTISSLEGHAATRYQNPGDHTTIGGGTTGSGMSIDLHM